jgi:hypothetical protein
MGRTNRLCTQTHKEAIVSTDRNTQVFTRHAGVNRLGRNVVCAIVACVLTLVLWGEVGKSAAQAAQRATAEQSDDDRNMALDQEAGTHPVARSAALI